MICVLRTGVSCIGSFLRTFTSQLPNLTTLDLGEVIVAEPQQIKGIHKVRGGLRQNECTELNLPILSPLIPIDHS